MIYVLYAIASDGVYATLFLKCNVVHSISESGETTSLHDHNLNVQTQQRARSAAVRHGWSRHTYICCLYWWLPKSCWIVPNSPLVELFAGCSLFAAVVFMSRSSMKTDTTAWRERSACTTVATVSTTSALCDRMIRADQDTDRAFVGSTEQTPMMMVAWAWGGWPIIFRKHQIANLRKRPGPMRTMDTGVGWALHHGLGNDRCWEAQHNVPAWDIRRPLAILVDLLPRQTNSRTRHEQSNAVTC